MPTSRLIDAWNTKDPARVVALSAPDGVRHQFAYPETHLEGHDAIGQMVAALMHSTPNFALTERSFISAGNRQAIQWAWDGNIENDLGDLPGHGQEVHLNGTSVVELSDGLITLENVYWDTATLLIGAGLLTAGA